MNTNLNEITLTAETFNKLPGGSKIVGMGTIRNPNVCSPSDPDLIQVLKVEIVKTKVFYIGDLAEIRTYMRTSYFTLDGEYVGDC